MSVAPVERVRLAKEAVHEAAVGQLDAAEPERRRHQREKGADGGARHVPDLERRWRSRRQRTRSRPGLGGMRAGQREQAVGGRRARRSRSSAPRSSSWPFSGSPDRCAPTTAIGSDCSAAGWRASGRRARCRRGVLRLRRASMPGAPASSFRSVRARRRRLQGAMKVTPKGRSPGGDAGGHRQRAPAEQVDEVGVGAEPGIDARSDRHRPRRSEGGRARSAPSAGRPRSTSPARRRCASRSRYCATKASVAESLAPLSMTLRTTGSSASG